MQSNPDIINKLPRHFTHFVEDAIKELSQVQNTIYEGQVLKGIRNGLGQLKDTKTGDVYKGTFKYGERSGTGLCMFGKTGSIYKGEWRDDKPCGNGIFFTLPGEIIETRFNADSNTIMDGQVKWLLQNGEFYEGQLKNCQRSGTGH